jgi:hypothetical protein
MKTLNDSILKKIVEDKAVQDKMEALLRLNGVEPVNDPLMRAAQVSSVFDHLKKKYAEKMRFNFTDDSTFENFRGSLDFDEQAEVYADEQLYQMGFLGFDDDETEHLNILGGVLKLGGKLIKGAVQKVGGAIKKGIEKKMIAKQEAAQAGNTAEIAQARANAISAGIPQSTTDEIIQRSMASVKNRLDSTVDRDELLQVGEKITEGNKKQSAKILDILTDAVDDFKKSEKQQEIGKMMPMIILAVIGFVMLGMFMKKM